MESTGEYGGADAVRSDRMRGDGEIPFVRLPDTGLELLRRERTEGGRDPRREDAAGRDQLDRGRAAADLLADGGPDGVGTVDLPRERDVVAVAAGHGERATGREDPWPRDQTGGHGSRDVDARAAHPTEIADGGHARVQVPLRVAHRLDRGEAGARELLRLLLEVGATVELEMDVDVDQARHQGLAGAGDLASGARCSRSPRMRSDPLDPVGAEEDAVAPPDRLAIEQVDVGDIGRFRHRGIMSSGVRQSPS